MLPLVVALLETSPEFVWLPPDVWAIAKVDVLARMMENIVTTIALRFILTISILSERPTSQRDR